MSNEQLPHTNDAIANQLDELKQIQLEGSAIAVRNARYTLLIAAAVILAIDLRAIYRKLGSFDTINVTISVTIFIIFAGLALWTIRKPYTALLSGIIAVILHRVLQVSLHAYINGTEAAVKALLAGAIITGLILYKLIPALPDAKKLQEAKEER